MKKFQRQNCVMPAALMLSWVLLFGTSPAAAQDAKLLAVKAREEGKVVFYTTMALPDARPRSNRPLVWCRRSSLRIS